MAGVLLIVNSKKKKVLTVKKLVAMAHKRTQSVLVTNAMTTPHTTNDNDNRAEQQARAQLASIREMVAALNKAQDEGADDDEARETIFADALSVEVRSDWTNPGEELKPSEFQILLCTGGPAVRIIGELSEHGEPDKARVEYQDWFTAWDYLPMTDEESEDVLTYCQQFYFGE